MAADDEAAAGFSSGLIGEGGGVDVYPLPKSAGSPRKF